MELLYCSRCQRAIPPGGPDEGKYFQLANEIICPKCYYKTKPGDHSGATVPVQPVSDERLLGAGRITPAEAARPHKPPTTKGPAFKPPTSRIMPAAKKSPSRSSSRLRAVREPGSKRRLAVPLGLAAGLIIAALAVFLWARSRGPDRPAGNGTGPVGSGAQPLPAPNPGRPPSLPSPKPEPEPPGQPRPIFTPAPAPGPTPGPGPTDGLVLHFQLDEKGGTAVRDFSGGGHDGRAGKGVSWVAGRMGGAAEFDGATGEIFVNKAGGNAAAGAKNTVTFWVKWSGGDDQIAFAWGSQSSLWFHKSGHFGFNTGEGGVLGTKSAGLRDQWTHVAAIFSNGVPSAANCRLYLNGQVQTLIQNGGSSGESFTAGDPVFIGRWWLNEGHHFRGLIDDLRIYNRELPAEELAKLVKSDDAAPKTEPAPKPEPAPGPTPEPGPAAGAFSVVLKTYRGRVKKPTVEATGTANSFRAGALIANDRDEKWKTVPAGLSGMTRLLAAREDRTLQPAGRLYVVNVSGPCTVYLPLDARYRGAKLSWMDDSWTDSGLTCERDREKGQLRIMRKEIAKAGDIELGCDTHGETIGMCYVFVPAAAPKEGPASPESGPPVPK